MSGFILPVKDVILNDDTQVVVTDLNGVAYTAATNGTPTTGGFQLQGFLGPTLNSQLVLLGAAVRIREEVAVAGVAQVATYTVTSTASPADAVFRLVYEHLELVPVEYQNGRVEKRYQISAAQASAATIGPKIAAVINADKYAPVTASAAGAVVTLTAKQKGVTFNLYSDDFAGTFAVTVQPSLPVNTYDSLKSINWSKNVEIDRNLNYFPIPNTSYTSYYFEILSDSVYQLGHSQVPSEVHAKANTAFKVYTKAGSATQVALAALAADVNV